MNDFLININPYESAGILFAVALLIHIGLSNILNRLLKHTNKTPNKLDDQIIKAISSPLKLLIWFGWLFFSLEAFKDQIVVFSSVLGYIDITPMFIITWGVVRIVSGVEEYLVEQDNQIDNDSIRLFSRLVKILVITAILLAIAQFLGFSISSLLTFGGVGGIVIGFAAKDMLSNVFGGLMIQMDKPFSTGDWIRSSEFEGVVEKIGWRMTRIRTFSKNPVYIPNSIFASIPIETPSRMTNRRIKETIGIRYNDIGRMADIVSEVKNMLNKNQFIDQKEVVRVYFNYFNSSSVDFIVYAYTNTIDKSEYQQIKQEILLDIAQIIDKHGAEIAFPTQTLHIQNNTES